MTDTVQHPEDSDSDPAKADADDSSEGNDWSDEGGATPAGPATDTDDA